MNLPRRALEKLWLTLIERSRLTEDGCLEWLGARDPRDYGRIGILGRTFFAHRIAFEYANGPIQSGLSICHHCDNPPCFEPEHLFAGRHADNMADMARKGRAGGGPQVWGERHPMRVLSFAQVEDIRRRFVGGPHGNRVALAAEFGVTKEAIWKAATGRTWAKP